MDFVNELTKRCRLFKFVIVALDCICRFINVVSSFVVKNSAKINFFLSCFYKLQKHYILIRKLGKEPPSEENKETTIQKSKTEF